MEMLEIAQKVHEILAKKARMPEEVGEVLYGAMVVAVMILG